MASLASIRDARNSLQLGYQEGTSQRDPHPLGKTRHRLRVSARAGRYHYPARRPGHPRRRKVALNFPRNLAAETLISLHRQESLNGKGKNHTDLDQDIVTEAPAPADISAQLDNFPIHPSSMRDPCVATSTHAASINTSSIDSFNNPSAAQHSTPATHDSTALPLRFPPKQRSRAAKSSGTAASPALHALDGAAADDSSSQRSCSVSPSLIEAISRNIALQLRLASYVGRELSSTEPRTRTSESADELASRTASQVRALDRFTQELQRYADNTGARGKILNFTPTPTGSGKTLRTISALMPFRSEFTGAGLAVTARDQVQRLPQFYVGRSRVRPAANGIAVPPGLDLSSSQKDGPSERRNALATSRRTSADRANGMKDNMYKQKNSWGQSAVRDRKRSPCLFCLPSHAASTTDGSSKLEESPRRQHTMVSNTPDQLPPEKSKGRLPCLGSFLGISVANGKRRLPLSKPLYDNPGNRGLDPVQDDSPLSVNQLAKTGNGAVFSRTPDAVNRASSAGLLGTKIPDSVPRLGITTSQTTPLNRSPDSMAGEPAYHGIGSHPSCSAPVLPRLQDHQRSISVTHDGAAESTKKMSGTSQKEPSGVVCGMTPPRINSEAKLAISPHKGKGVYAGMLRQPTVPQRTSSMRPGLHSESGSLGPGKRHRKPHHKSYMDKSRHRLSDRDVLNGLKIAVSVACDEAMDEFVQSKTGLQIRRFLADLVILDTFLDENTESDKQEMVRRMRTRMKRLKLNVRRTRELQKLVMLES
ncbi:hypothetical protein B0I35DRAFT_137617 [Stachybotrys elegans]|uniref:Uncharacterized protein n=1 Tax=Stachybotrys elegans TaxID=80388 RepID=A0A8K0T133_9HYPO|nr:hypothetical protein B0I35DRAFT_137617 [Stachybotrys elegans]